MAGEWWVRGHRDTRALADARRFFTDADLEAVREWYRTAAVTPLLKSPGLARELGIGELLIKDETARFGLPSFKILGAHYAVGQLARRHGAALADLACATAGNHGLAVAVAGRDHGCEVHVSVPIGTPRPAVDAILAAGAHVVVTSMDYDRTVRLMAAEAVENGWTIVSDTTWDGGDDAIPRAIMAGYTRLMDEASDQWDAAPDLIVVQAGVGSLAGAVAGWLQSHSGESLAGPRLVLAEPEGAACAMTSLRAAGQIHLERCAPTIMAGLRCARVSAAAWPILERRVDAALAVSDDDCRAAQARLAGPTTGDPAIASGPSGACGLAALIAICTAPELAPLRMELQLSSASRCLVIVTEGAPVLPGPPRG